METVILRDDRFLEHDPGFGHPENPGRLRAIHEDLDARPPRGTRFAAPREATPDELERVHHASHIERMAQTAGGGLTPLDMDTATSERSYEVALLAAGSVVQATELVVAGTARGAFALVRPPGHHAERDRAMGFCLFNNVAVAAAHATAKLGCRRVAILDPDVHHGNGTQHAFWTRPDVLYVSSHRYPFYPGTGAVTEIGAGEGRGATVNLPLAAGAGDGDLLYLYREIAGPILEEFRPDLIVVSAGFDTWKRDPIGGMSVTEEGFAALFALFARWTAKHCPGRLVLALEGGYHPAGLVAGVRAALAAATGENTENDLDARESEAARVVARAARKILAPHWPSLRN
ncbi:MAG: histone deacetylase [Planctomycetes bacterium]|nr:histone deacetylase [Planctomycetota bacterium]